MLRAPSPPLCAAHTILCETLLATVAASQSPHKWRVFLHPLFSILLCHQTLAVRHLGLTHESQALAQYAKVGACLRLLPVCVLCACPARTACLPSAVAHLTFAPPLPAFHLTAAPFQPSATLCLPLRIKNLLLTALPPPNVCACFHFQMFTLASTFQCLPSLPPSEVYPCFHLPPFTLTQVYTQLLVEVAGGRDLRQAVSAAARSVGLDLGKAQPCCYEW